MNEPYKGVFFLATICGFIFLVAVIYGSLHPIKPSQEEVDWMDRHQNEKLVKICKSGDQIWEWRNALWNSKGRPIKEGITLDKICD